MPVEIRELIIRAVTAQGAEAIEEQASSEDRLQRSEPADNTQAIIQECVRQVLRILQQKKER
jgi:hypothetical protein